MTTNQKGTYKNLLAQLDKVVRHTRQGSFKTRDRYTAACKRFCRFLADTYKLEKLANIAPKHIKAYTEFLQDKGLSASTIKTDLTAIRFYHDQMANTKHILPSNQKLNLVRRKFGGVDRSWSSLEFNKFLALCLSKNRHDYTCMACLGYYAGLRIEECFKVDTAQAEKSLKINILTTKGKGGLVRNVMIQESIKIELRKMLELTPRGEKLFVAPDEKTHLAIKRFQNFINYHRKSFTENNLTFHGIRHAYAQNKYTEFKNDGLSDFEARKKVAELLGHNRDDVTRIYLSKGGEHNV